MCCLFLETATADTVTATKAAAIKASTGLLNSGTDGEAVGLETLEGSDITAKLPILPDVEPGLLIA